MRSSFSRVFFPVVLVLLVALLSVGILFQTLAKRQVEKNAMTRLENNARTVAQLAAAYHRYEIESPEEFYINMAVAARISDSETVICDANGTLCLCSGAPMGCEHVGLVIGQEYLDEVIQKGCVRNTGVIQGLYEEPRHIVSVVITDSNEQIIGMVMTSAPVGDSLQVLQGFSRIHMLLSVIVIVLAVSIMIPVAKQNSRHLQQMSKTAIDFGHGKLDARVPVDPDSPQEVQELALAFNNMASSLQKSEYRRQEFVANVSHELKTPMTTIAGFADGILDGTIPPQRQDHYLQLISEETKRLSRLVRSMLDTTRLQEGGGVSEEQKTRFDLQECAGRVLLSFEQKITAKNLEVQVDMPEYPVFTRAHQDHIVQVLYNLLDNAVKFCPRDGTLGLKLHTGGSKIYVAISNSGQTIPPQELPLVFDRFHKTDKSRAENRDSWGLGLYIVHTIICAHGEDISVTSRDGITEFTFTLPYVN